MKHGRDVANRNPNSPTISQKSTPVRTIPRSSGIEMRKTPARNSDDGDDKYPPKKNLEKSHTVYTPIKRKKYTENRVSHT